MIFDFCSKKGIPLRKNLPLCELTTFRIGGPADVAVSPVSTEQMAELIGFLNRNSQEYFVLGRGSDILASDKGYRGILVLTEGLKELSSEGDTIRAGAGCSMASVSNLALKQSLAGLEFLHGIPGSVGGGVFMNAGAYGSEIATYLDRIEWVDRKGEIHNDSVRDLEFSYRHSSFAQNGGIVCGVTLRCVKGNPGEIKALMQDLDGRRRDKQPLEYPSAGSTFKRPEGYFAGKLIEDCGLKGYTVGGACVSEKHAGFVINKNNATAADVHAVMDHVSRCVMERFGVAMEPEVRFLGE